ncbi:PP2C family protein-serine/threonine phosphatase [Thalassiella azotivora]
MTRDPRTPPPASTGALLDLATSAAGVLNEGRLAALVLSRLVPATTPAGALLVLDEAGLRVRAVDADGRSERSTRPRSVGDDVRGVLRDLVGGRRPLDDDELAALRPVVPVDLGASPQGVPLAVQVGGTRALLVLADPVGDVDDRVVPLLRGHLDAALRYAQRSGLATQLAGAYRPRLSAVPAFDVATRYRPSREEDGVGGDFVDLVDRGGDWTLVLGDVTGHGAEAAVATGRIRQTLRVLAHLHPEPVDQLALADRVLRADDTGGGMRFATAVVVRLRPSSGPHGEAGGTAGAGGAGSVRATVARAGHPAPLLLRTDGTVTPVEPRGPLLGIVPDPSWEQADVVLERGDTLLLFSDGVTEAGRASVMLGAEGLVDLVRHYAGMPAEAVASVVEEIVIALDEGAARDDVAIVAVGVPLTQEVQDP